MIPFSSQEGHRAEVKKLKSSKWGFQAFTHFIPLQSSHIWIQLTSDTVSSESCEPFYFRQSHGHIHGTFLPEKNLVCFIIGKPTFMQALLPLTAQFPEWVSAENIYILIRGESCVRFYLGQSKGCSPGDKDTRCAWIVCCWTTVGGDYKGKTPARLCTLFVKN